MFSKYRITREIILYLYLCANYESFIHSTQSTLDICRTMFSLTTTLTHI